MSKKDSIIRVPYSLVFGDFGVKRIVTVYMAIASYAGKERIAVLSLKDIIYTLGLKPKSGRGKINEQIAVAVNALRTLGYLEQAPEYAIGTKVTASKRYGFKLAPVPAGRKVSSGITKNMLRAINNIERYHGQYNDDTNSNKKIFSFSAETAAKTLFAIREVIAVVKGDAAYIPRKYLSRKVGVTENRITEVVAYLVEEYLINKRSVFMIDLHDNLKRLTFYTNTYGDNKEVTARLDDAIKAFKDKVNAERSKCKMGRSECLTEETRTLFGFDFGDCLSPDDCWGEVVNIGNVDF